MTPNSSKDNHRHCTVVSWNVNSIKARLERVLDFCQRFNPDILCLQELKCLAEVFPYELFAELGYQHTAVVGQKQYNGVAILSKYELSKRKGGFAANDPAARWVEAVVKDLRVICLYAPNGSEVGSDKYAYKLSWYEQATRYLQANYRQDEKTVLVGDFNVVPTDLDVYDPQACAGQVPCSAAERQALVRLCALGYQDYLRHKYPHESIYSWWDYRHLSFPQNKGFRIDYALVSQALVPFCYDATVVRDERKGKKPSDHVPVILTCARELLV